MDYSIPCILLLLPFSNVEATGRWPLVINNYEVKNLYHCIYIYFICTDHIGTWPQNKDSCVNYFVTCLDSINTGRKKDKTTSCNDLRQSGETTSGVYELEIGGRKKSVFCDMEDDGGGWTILQRRGDFGNKPNSFLRKWKQYESGFGDPSKDFWIGLESMHHLTKTGNIQLKITLEDFENNSTSLIVNNFVIGSSKEGYNISYKHYNSKIGNSMPARGTKFSTVDKDNDAWSKSCAQRFSGAWWYSACHNSNLNGLYLRGKHESFGNGVNWYHFRGYHYSLKETEMKIRNKKS